MSEYWVSQAKHYCKICNCYIADNKASRAHHENGVKHKEKVEMQQKQKRLDKLHGARSEIELKQQLAEIEKAAKEAIAVDRSEQDGFFYQNSGVRGRPPPPPAPRPPGFPKPSQAAEGEDQEGLEEDDGTGMYTVKGQTYLVGKIHEEKIRAGMECQIFVEAQDEWYSGRIEARHDTPIPHTELFLVTFDVEYNISSQDTTAVEVIKDLGIKSDRIRLLAEPDGTLPGYVDPTVPPPRVVDEYTGIGVWQTVAVREVDEEAEEVERVESERVRDLMLRGRDAGDDEPKTKRRAPQQGDEDFEDHTDSALSAYDPYNRQRGIYKGIKLQEDANFKEQIESVAEGANISFKKRKSASIKTEPSNSTSSSAGVSSNSVGGSSGSSSGGHGASSSVDAPVTSAASGSTTNPTTNNTNTANTTPTTTDTTTPTTTTAPPPAPAPAPISISMKIGNMNGGAKRKFRVREPSP